MRRRVVFALIVGASLGAGFVACGIDEHGEASDGGIDATSNDSPIVIDSPIDVPIDVPQACKTLDASGCVDASVPDGWTLAVVTPGDQLCPTTVDYDKTNFLQNPVPQGGCVCGCTTTGSVDCSGKLEAGSGGSCNDPNKWFIMDAGNAAACFNTSWSDQHYAIPVPPTSTANVHCDAGPLSAPGWSASTVTSCTPKCTADFCNVGSTYKRCILGTGACPAPFTQQQQPLGIEAGVVTACTGCGCSVTSGACSAVIQPFASNDCNNPPVDASVTDGGCNQTNVGGSPGQVNSITYTPIVPDASCIPTAGNPAAQFASSVTVCCLP
jgi:hypothetical protein